LFWKASPAQPRSPETRSSGDALNDVVMLQQLAAAGGGASFFHGLNEADGVLQDAVNGILDQLAGVLASPSCDFA